MKYLHWFIVFPFLLYFYFPHLNAQITGIDSSLIVQELEVEISCDKTESIQGQLIDVLVKIKNNTGSTVKLKFPDQYIFSLRESKTFDYHPSSNDLAFLDIPSFHEYCFLINPLTFINYKKEDKGLLPALPWYYWPEGEYDYYITYKIRTTSITSNKIKIVINTVPDSLIKAFTDLKSFYPYTQYGPNRDEILFEKYKNTFYEKEYYYKMLIGNIYTDSQTLSSNRINDNSKLKVKDLYKEFILKYPNTEAAYFFLKQIYNYRDRENEKLLREILNSIKNDESADILLQVLECQKKYWLKDLDHYGFKN